MDPNTNWFENAIIYQILIDRFAGYTTNKNTPDFLGGTLKGITEKLDYLSGLGINAIWLTPFFETRQYHGYHITDFEKVDGHFGSIDDLKTLIYKAHEKSIKIISDFVPNHCSMWHPFFIDAIKNEKSNYHDWFCFKEWPYDYLCFLAVKELPKLNLENTETREYIIGVAEYWLEKGLDGYRIDHIIGPSHDFWKVFYNRVKKKYPNAVLFGEAVCSGIDRPHFETLNFKHKFWRKYFPVSQENLQLEYRGEMDGILDFKLNDFILDIVRKTNNFIPSEKLNKKVKKHLDNYTKDYIPVTFLDTHDMDRFLFHCRDENGTPKYDILIKALDFLMSLNKPVVIYYGTEQGVYNERSLTKMHGFPHADLTVRETFDWNHTNDVLFNQISTLFKKHIAQRNTH